MSLAMDIKRVVDKFEKEGVYDENTAKTLDQLDIKENENKIINFLLKKQIILNTADNKYYLNQKGRFISDNDFKLGIAHNELDGLFDYLSKNKEKYNLTIRNNKFTLYSCGRKVDLERLKNKKIYRLSFDLNNATEMLEDDLNNILEVLAENGFDTSKVPEWKKNHKNNHYLSANISFKKIKEYNFATVFDEMFKIFSSYKDKRPEEAFKQEFTYKYDNINNDYLVFDTEYAHKFDSKSEKKDAEKTVKADLVALKKKDKKYEVVFIELKENINACVNGDSSNIGNHIIDTLNFQKMYNTNVKEKNRFIRYVKENISFKSLHKLIEVGDADEVIKNIDFSKAPDILIVCGFKNYNEKTQEQLRKKLKNKFNYKKNKKYNEYQKYKKWKNKIIIGEKNPQILVENKGIAINKFLR